VYGHLRSLCIVLVTGVASASTVDSPALDQNRYASCYLARFRCGPHRGLNIQGSYRTAMFRYRPSILLIGSETPQRFLYAFRRVPDVKTGCHLYAQFYPGKGGSPG
jgi:hypothetical protein